MQVLSITLHTEDRLPRAGYGAVRDRDVGHPWDRVYEEQLGRAGRRDGDAPGGGGDLMGYGGGALGANDLGLGPGLGGGGLPDENQLMGARMGSLDVAMGGRPGGLGLNGGAPEPDVLSAGLDVLPPDASSMLVFDGLPQDCSHREAAHIFSPFIGFNEVRLVHKDAKRFADARSAATALEALQGPRGPARDDPYRGGRDRGEDYNNRSRGGGRGGRR